MIILSSNTHFVTVVSLILLLIFTSSSAATRIRIEPHQEDPPTEQVYNDFRHLRADPNYYYLEQAGVSVSQDETNQAFLRGSTVYDQSQFLRDHFKFNSSEHIRRALTYRWYSTLEERVALHVYDDPKEMELSIGAQVNQELCGVHLNYMIHMMRKHHKHITSTTDLAMFKLLHAFDLPHHGLSEGNTIFPGSYETCSTSELSIIKQELTEMFAGNSREASKYFTLTISLGNGEHRVLTAGNLLNRIRKLAQQNSDYFKPFFGYFVGDSLTYRPINLVEHSKLKTIEMRYCFASLRWASWSNSSWSRRHMSMRVTTCLPETCDSSSLNIHRDKLIQLIDKQMTSYYSQYYIEDLFCLPDEKSYFRDPFNYTGTQLLITFFALWFTLTALATYRHYRKSGQSSCSKAHNHNLQSSYLKSWCIQKNLADFYAEKLRVAVGSNEIGKTSSSAGSVPERSSSNVPDNTSSHECGNHSNHRSKETSKNSISQQNKNATLNRLNLSPLEGLKVLCSLSVITSHAVILILQATQTPLTSESNWRSWLSIVGTLCPAMVNIFFVIHGSMTVRTIANIARERSINMSFWPRYIIYRYFKVVPLYVLMHLFLQHGFRFLGSGPFWDYGTSHSAWSRSCQDESVWRTLVPSSNFVLPTIHCNRVGWYLANDLQFTLLVPFIVPLLLKRPRLGCSLIAIAITLGTVTNIKYIWDHEPDARISLEWKSMTLNQILTDGTTTNFVNPQNRFISYLIGLLLGHLLVIYELRGGIEFPRWLFTGSKWYFHANLYFLCALPFLSSLVLDCDETFLRYLSVIIKGTSHLTSTLAIGAFALLLVSNHYNSWITQILGSKLLRLIASMTHSTMLVHLPLMFYHQQTMRTLPLQVTKYDIYKTTLVWTFEALVLSFVVYIFFEAPLRRFLIKLLLSAFSEDGHQKSASNKATGSLSKNNGNNVDGKKLSSTRHCMQQKIIK